MEKGIARVEDYNNGISFLKTLPKKNVNNLLVEFTCSVCNNIKIISANSFIKKQNLVCGRCSQREKITVWANENKGAMKERLDKAIMDKYGVTNTCFIPEVIKQKKETCLERYGTEYHISSKKVRDKIEDTFQENYGGHTPFASKEIQQKSKETNLNNHGGVWHTSTDENKEKIKATSQEKYGVDNVFQLQEVKDKIKNTFMENYGVDHNFKAPEIKEKRKNTMIERYGFEYPLQSLEIREKMLTSGEHIGALKGYRYNDINFDSSYELAYYLWLTHLNKQFIFHPKIPMSYVGNDGLEHLYMPDFLIEGKFYEIKGGCFFNKDNEPYNHYTKSFWWEKYNAILAAGVIILREPDIKEAFSYVKEAFRKDFLKSCKLDRTKK